MKLFDLRTLISGNFETNPRHNKTARLGFWTVNSEVEVGDLVMKWVLGHKGPRQGAALYQITEIVNVFKGSDGNRYWTCEGVDLINNEIYGHLFTPEVELVVQLHREQEAQGNLRFDHLMWFL